MKQLYYVICTLLRGRSSNIIKVISLGLALTMSILLFARVAFEKSCNTCYKDYTQLYQVFSIWTINGECDKEPSEMNLPVIAGTILESFPDEVEAAVTICKYMVTGPLYNGSVRFSDNKIMADSLFFRTMGIEVLTGDAVRELQQKDVVFLSDRLARKIFGNENPIGKIISYDKQIQLTVKGTYAAVPENSTMNPEAVISLATAWSRGWDDNNWKGGDSYYQYIRFRPGVKVDIDKFSARLDIMVQNHVPRDMMRGVGCTLFVKSIYDVYQDSDITKRMVYIMSILGCAILFITALNYVLISISSLVYRAKVVGIHKCSGASGSAIFGMFLLETGIMLFIAMGVMVVLLYNFRELIENTMEVRIRSLFMPERLWIPVLVLLILFVVGAVLPGQLFARIPVSQVFRRYTEGKKGWKRPLLFIQFAGVAFVCGLMCVVMAQYHYVLNKDMGYNARNIVTGRQLYFGNEAERGVARQFLGSLPYVEAVESASCPPCVAMSGMMVFNESGQAQLSSRYCTATEGYLKMMGMVLKEGRMARERNEAVVNETFVKMLRWGDDVLGRTIHNGHTSLGDLKVVGILKDFQMNSYYVPQQPLIVRHNEFGGCIHIRLKEPFTANLRKLNSDASAAFPDKTVDFTSLEQEIQELYNTVHIFRNATMLATIVMFFVMIMGLIGYVTDEIRRRSKEIAIRKVNGAEASTILDLLSRDVFYVAAPAIIAGTVGAWYVNGIWMGLFTVQVSLGWPVYVLIAIINLLIIIACVIWKAWDVANENPVKSVKSE